MCGPNIESLALWSKSPVKEGPWSLAEHGVEVVFACGLKLVSQQDSLTERVCGMHACGGCLSGCDGGGGGGGSRFLRISGRLVVSLPRKFMLSLLEPWILKQNDSPFPTNLGRVF